MMSQGDASALDPDALPLDIEDAISEWPPKQLVFHPAQHSRPRHDHCRVLNTPHV